MAWILGLLNVIFGFAIKAWQAHGPAPVVVEAQDLGVAIQAASTDAASAKTESTIAQAEAQAPKTQGATVTALKGGKF